jgi:LacI family transcriptional regulator
VAGRATIADVARAAGVSVATVDRVLNRRPGVRGVTVQRVEAAVSQLDYRPDAFASRLARGGGHRFAFILPTGNNVFMSVLGQRVESLKQVISAQRVDISTFWVDVFDAETLSEAIERIGHMFDGLAVVALDHVRVRSAIDDVVAAGKPVITLVSDAPASRRAHFVGIDNSAAGRTAATLLGRFLGNRAGPVAVFMGSSALRDHAERLYGFTQIISSDFPHLTLLPPRESRDDTERLRQLASDSLAQRPDLIGIYNIGSGLPGIAEALKSSGRARDVVFIGHELMDHSRRLLIDGTLDAVLNQDAGHEVRSAIRLLIAARGGEPIIADQERIRIDVFVRDNMP